MKVLFFSIYSLLYNHFANPDSKKFRQNLILQTESEKLKSTLYPLFQQIRFKPFNFSLLASFSDLFYHENMQVCSLSYFLHSLKKTMNMEIFLTLKTGYFCIEYRKMDLFPMI